MTHNFNEVSESVDGLQIQVNLADPKIKNSVVIISDSNSSTHFHRIKEEGGSGRPPPPHRSF